MISLVFFAAIAGFGVFASLCISAPEWDDEAETPAALAMSIAEGA